MHSLILQRLVLICINLIFKIDRDADNESMQTAAGVIQAAVTKSLHSRPLPNSKTVDEILMQLRGESPELNLGDNITTVISYGIAKAIARGKGLPLYKCIIMCGK